MLGTAAALQHPGFSHLQNLTHSGQSLAVVALGLMHHSRRKRQMKLRKRS